MKNNKYIKVILVIIVTILLVSIFIVLSKNKTRDISYNSIEELRGKRIGTLLGSPLTEEKTRKIIPEVEVSFYNDAMDSIASLQARQIDGAIVSYPTAFLVTKNIPELKVLSNLT